MQPAPTSLQTLKRHQNQRGNPPIAIAVPIAIRIGAVAAGGAVDVLGDDIAGGHGEGAVSENVAHGVQVDKAVLRILLLLKDHERIELGRRGAVALEGAGEVAAAA
eukprot:CAMPEP_0196739678 /NCGR_PEP_ID=MMETSP1091-20130531/24818_2 /TAXON_ID=302021 /ORGANISM="Rhodomonas sp., Strain CCMP768" /LENGTH=105 /DNA_ID=CAMNT_0042084359 /DNA_START=180 /DNA_END=494 /DNA_ORIENTATION=-